MPSWAKLSNTEVGELTFEVVSKRAAVRCKPSLEANVLVVLHKGERVTGRVEDGWLRLSPATIESHPHRKSLERAEAAYAQMEGGEGRGPLMKRAPAELGWCAAASESTSSDVLEVVGTGNLNVIGEDGDSDYLGVGSLVKVLERKGQRLRFETLSGDGPREGWVDDCSSLIKVSSRTAPQVQSTADTPPQDIARATAALQRYSEIFQAGCSYKRCGFAWGREEKGDVEGALERELGWAALARGQGGCPQCRLPLGPLGYLSPDGELVHAECMAKILLQDLQREDLERLKQEKVKKDLRRKEYLIGWRKEFMVTNVAALKQLTGRDLPHGLCAVALASEGGLTLVPTVSPKAAVNVEYLSIALKVRRDEAREPLFSLDPVDPSMQDSMQVKRFEPYWLKGTKAGDVLFEADYHLKELSMGEYEQPVVGMKSAFYWSDQEGKDAEWSAREWFVVRSAEVWLSEDGVLVPHVRMGVEAREQKLDKQGHLQDVRVTRDNHPMLKYAEEFTKNFQLIAERKSVFHELRELAKASVLAKYLMTSKESSRLAAPWFELYESKDADCILEIPQLWNERGQSQIHVHSGKILKAEESSLRAVYGGVQFGLGRFRMAPGTAATPITARRGFTPSGQIIARRGLFAQGGVASTRLTGPRGVDFNLDQFALDEARFSLDETNPGPVHGPMAWGEELSDSTCIGTCFWKELEGPESIFNEQQRTLFGRVFNDSMSDRRMEEELFTPPEDFGGDKLQQLVDEEQRVCDRRKAHFYSPEFRVGAAGPLFPDSWTSDFEIASGAEAEKKLQQIVGQLEPRPEYLAQEERIRQALESSKPVFDRTAEDGCRFRIHRFGRVEVRTTQDLNSTEVLGAVFSVRCPTLSAGTPGSVSGEERVAKVTEYVERDSGSRNDVRYYVQLETEQGNTIVSERLKDGSATWYENPANTEERNSLAKVLRAGEHSKVTVHELAAYRDNSSKGLRAYADGLFELAAEASERKQPLDDFLTPMQRAKLAHVIGDHTLVPPTSKHVSRGETKQPQQRDRCLF